MGDDSEYPPAYFLDHPEVAVSSKTLKALVRTFSPSLFSRHLL
jgi:hypothetical protein